MCGLFALSGQHVTGINIDAAMASISHRGPDDRGQFRSRHGDVVLGHHRLAILDLSSASRQPMRDGSGRYTIAFNGEIYNFIELKADLERAYGAIEWKGHGDTEVLIEGYAREGDSFFRKLNGMYAILIYDERDRKLIVARDPVGIKPLFVAPFKSGIAFASELKAFRHIPNLELTLRPNSIADMMQFAFVPEPYTFYQEVTKVPAGALWHIRDDVIIKRDEIRLVADRGLTRLSEPDLVDQFRDILSAAVNRQCRSDVPVGIMLSGGLDSSSLALECKEQGRRLERAYVLATDNQAAKRDMQSDDLGYARQMAALIGVELDVIAADEKMLETLPHIAPFLDDGIADPAAIASYLIYKRSADQGFKVLLTGQGADEFLFGYRRYQATAALHKIPNIAQKVFGKASALVPSTVFGQLNAPLRRAKRLLSLMSKDEGSRIVDLYSVGNVRRQFGILPPALEQEPGRRLVDLYQNLAGADQLDRLHQLDIAYDLRSLNLVYTDRMSMACGVEARVPYLDFDLIRFLEGLPNRFKLRGETTKYIQKKAFKGRLPNEIIHRSKAGFALPIRSWLTGNSELVQDLVDEKLFRELGLFDMQAFGELKASVSLGHEDDAFQLFALICFRMWYESTQL